VTRFPSLNIIFLRFEQFSDKFSILRFKLAISGRLFRPRKFSPRTAYISLFHFSFRDPEIRPGYGRKTFSLHKQPKYDQRISTFLELILKFIFKDAIVGPNPTQKILVTRVSHLMASTEHAEHFTRVTHVSILIIKIVIQSPPNTEQKLSRMATVLSIFNAVSILTKLWVLF